VAGSTISVLRGRNPELASINGQFERLVSGVGSVTVIEGGPGMGKSRLLTEVERIARRRSLRLGMGVAEFGDSIVEMAALMDALMSGDDPLIDRAAIVGLPIGPERRYWFLEETQALLQRTALDHPLVIVIDDVQWADNGTAAALGTLPPRLADLPIAWILAKRPGQDSHRVANAMRELERHRAVKLRLLPLDEASVAQVGADTLGGEPDRALLDIAASARGNPFLLVELLAGMREEELVRVVAGRAELVALRVPRRARESMGARIERLSELARQVVTAGAVLSRRFSFVELSNMLSVPPAALVAPVIELVHADLIVEVGDRLSLRHELIRDAIRESLPASARRALERQAVDVLLAEGALPAEVATQLMASAEPGDDRAVGTLLKAAEAIGDSDPETAANLSRRAMELTTPEHELRGALVAQTAVWLHAAHRGVEATAFVDRELRAVLPTAEEAAVRLSIARMFGLSPDLRAASGRQALTLPNLPPSVRAQHLSALTYNLVAGGRVHDASELHEEARSATRLAHDAAATFTLTFATGCLQYVGGDLGRALETFDDALRTARGASQNALERVVVWWRCEALAALGRHDEAFAVATSAIAAAQRERQAWALHLFETWRGRHFLQIGNLGDAAASLGEEFDPTTDARVEYPPDAAGLVALGKIALHTGDTRQIRQTNAAAQMMLKQSTPGVQRHGVWLLVLQAFAAGDSRAAWRQLCVLGEDERTAILPVFPMDISDEAHLVRIAVAVEDHELAESATAAAERRAAQNPGTRALAAIAAHTRGLYTGSVERLAAAVDLLEGEQRPLALAAAAEDLGRAQIQADETQNGITSLDRALVTFVQVGATADASRVRSQLRERGIRRRVAVKQPTNSWGGMTDSELRVARLVAEGLTNREVAERLFVSPHTINGHLRQVFAKVGVNSRVELARRALDINFQQTDDAGA
jgi:DNA-binding CsgD family transcriptional regulator/tetratricopeptide (TPR) repeat protein